MRVNILLPLTLMTALILGQGCGIRLSSQSDASREEINLQLQSESAGTIQRNNQIRSIEFTNNTANRVVIKFSETEQQTYQINNDVTHDQTGNIASLDHNCSQPTNNDCEEMTFDLNLQIAGKSYQTYSNELSNSPNELKLVDLNVNPLNAQLEIKVEKVPTTIRYSDANNFQISYAQATAHILTYSLDGGTPLIADILVIAHDYDYETAGFEQVIEVFNAQNTPLSLKVKFPKRYQATTSDIDVDHYFRYVKSDEEVSIWNEYFDPDSGPMPNPDFSLTIETDLENNY